MNRFRQFCSEVMTIGIRNIWLFTKAEFKVITIITLLMSFTFNYIGMSMIFAFLIAIGISLIDLIPIVGSGIIFMPWIIIEWLSVDPNQAWQLLVIYLSITIIKQLIESFFLGKDLELPFWLPIVVVIACTMIFNVFGIMVSAILIPFISAYLQVSRKYKNI
ncbi:permease [Aerococcaceae bacterium WGS1372]